MMMDSTLNVTPEGSLDDLPAAVGGIEETREGTQIKFLKMEGALPQML